MSQSDAHSIPEAFAESFLNVQLQGQPWAWAELDATHRVIQSGGDWSTLGRGQLTVGTLAEEALPELLGMLPVETPQKIVAVHLGADTWANLVLFPRPGGSGLIVHDVSQQVAKQERLQQEGNQLSLVTRRLAERSVGSTWSSEDDLLGLLKMAVFEGDSAGGCRALGSLAPWVKPFVERQADGSQVLLRGDGLSFLDNFIEDAVEFWSTGEPGHLASGVWCENGPDGEERCFEALAVLDENMRRNLVLERVDARYQERQRVMQRARQAHLNLEALEGEVHKKEVLLQCIVHDLRGPLSNMMAVLGLLRDREIAPEKSEELLEIAQAQAERQDRMMRDLLSIFAAEVAALQSFERDAATAPDLYSALASQVRQMGPGFESAGVEIRQVGDPGPAPVAADADRLDRVLRNLVGNALRFAPEGSAVELGLERLKSSEHFTGPAFEVCVRDRGPGVAANEQESIFGRFQQSVRDDRAQEAATAESGSGTVGLGLYFCRNTVQTWGGKMGYRDREGGGAEFWFQLHALDAKHP